MANLGRVAYVHRGAYDSGALYEKYDVVYENTTNSAYAYINNVATIGSAVTNETYWTLLVSGSELNSTAENMPYLFIKYSENKPTTDGEISDTPGDWMGVYVGTSHTAPTTYTSYTWNNITGVHIGDDAPAGTEKLWIDTDEPDLMADYQSVLDARDAAVTATDNADDATDRANAAAQRIEDTEDAIAGIEAADATAQVLLPQMENAIQSTETATLSALEAQDANANWTKDGRNPAEYFPAPSAPLYFRREGTFTQAGSGDPSPENIRPITPFMANGEQITLANSGKNLFDISKVESGTIDHTTGLNASGSSFSRVPLIECTPDTQYILSYMGEYTTQTMRVFYYTSSGEYISFNGDSDYSSPFVFTTPATARFIRFRVYDSFKVDTQLELGSVDTPYEPYVGSTVTLTSPEEIAAGWMDNRGNGRATWVRKVFDGTESGLKFVSGPFPYYALTVGSVGVVVDDAGLCSHFKQDLSISAGKPGEDNVFNVINSAGYNDARIIFRPAVDGVTDLATVKTWLSDQYAAGTPVTVVYQLATPTALTPVSASLNTIPATDLTQERLNVFTSSMNGVLTYPKSKVGENRKFWNSQLWRKTASGNPVSVYPVPESPLYPKVSGTFTQSGTGDPSPENIRPITPWMASGGQAKVKRTGKNLFDIQWTQGKIDIDTGVITPQTSSAEYSQFLEYKGLPLVVTNYNVTGHNAIFTYDKNFNFVGRSASYNTPETRRVPSDVTVLVSGKSIDDIAYFVVKRNTADNTYFQIELGSTATPYEPYTEQEITLTAPQEIPAGWMDNEGNGQVTWGKTIIRSGDLILGNAGTDRWYMYSRYLDGLRVITHGGACNVYPSKNVQANNTVTGFTMYDGEIRFRPTVEEWTVADWNTHVEALYTAGTPLTVYYQLATPVTLTPAIAPLTALPQLDRITPRQNVLTASTGNIELTYAKSPIKESDEIATAIAAL